MSTLLHVGGSCVVALACACTSSRPEITVDVPVVSRYVFRGVVIDENPVIQPSLTVAQELTQGALSASLWTNFELSDDRGFENRLVEADATFDYSVSRGRFDLSVGGARYSYPRTGTAGTTELYVLASLNELYVTPSLELWYDIDEADGAYVNVNFGREFELGGGWGLFAAAGLGWMDSPQADYNFGVPRSGLSDLQAQAAATYPLTESVSFNMLAVWSSVIDDAYRAAVDEPENVVLAIGLAMTL